MSEKSQQAPIDLYATPDLTPDRSSDHPGAFPGTDPATHGLPLGRPDEATAPPLKGSWEAILQEAQELAANQNDAAIPLFDKLIKRLSKLAESKRRAHDGRLQQIFTVAAVNAQSYLTLRGRYDDALAVLEQLTEIGDEHEEAYAEFQRGLILLMAERNEEALVAVRQRTEREDTDIADWGQLVITHLRLGQIEAAIAAVEETAAWMEREFELGIVGPEEQPEWRGYVATLWADIALRQRDWEAATQHFDRALALDEMYQNNPHLFYTSLMQAEQPALALRYIKQDREHPIRQNFWMGVAHRRLGEEEQAQAAWQRVLTVDLEKSEEPSFSEYVLTHYYLGDKERIGLGNILRILQEDRRYDWQTLFLAGLGWAIQDDLDSASTNLQFSVNQRRTAAMGKELPYQTWTYCLDLLDEAAQQRLSKYFETKWT